MTRDADEASKVAKAHSVFVRLALPPYTIHFKSPHYLRPDTLDLLDKRVCKETLKSTAQDASVREAIGTDDKFWKELVTLLKAAIPSLERRSFTIWDPSSVDYESTSGALIAGNYPGLWRDLERLNDLISISRNVLTVGMNAQDLAYRHSIDSELFRLVNCCVRVTARGYDGDAGTGEEEKWQWIVNAYKKLLITSLQFLNNLVAQNERRKLMLWVALFDNPSDSVIESGMQEQDTEEKLDAVTSYGVVWPTQDTRPFPPIDNNMILLAYGRDGTNRLSPLEMEGAVPLYKEEGFASLPPQAEAGKKTLEPNAYVYFVREMQKRVLNDYKVLQNRNPTLAEMHLNMPNYWFEETKRHFKGDADAMWNIWTARLKQAFQFYKNDMADWEKRQQEKEQSELTAQAPKATSYDLPPTRKMTRNETQTELKMKVPAEELAQRYKPEIYTKADVNCTVTPGREHVFIAQPLDPNPCLKDDLEMPFTADAGARILESGKGELMKRLEGYQGQREVDGAVVGGVRRRVSDSAAVRRRSLQNVSVDAGVNVEEAFAEDEPEEEEDESEEDGEEGDEDDEEEDYPGSTEDGRGLLTDVPLILGPSEIEVLPMLIMSGIVPPVQPVLTTATPNERRLTDMDPSHYDHSEMAPIAHYSSNLYPLRTHLLLSQTSGRNLLRELLIFVAAWDLREEELYFKFMVKILEGILKAGLMPFAYWSFRDRSRSKDIISPAQAVVMKLLTCIFRGRAQAAISDKTAVPSSPPTIVDLQILNFIFTEFRQHIIPQTCALIFLQGQIHKGRASPEDFPLNLWDMERMYEGVYQFLEFFAVLGEDQSGGRESASADGYVHPLQRRRGEEDGDDQTFPFSHKSVPADGRAFSWKRILAEWEMASELVTLLRELERGIPKMSVTARASANVVPPVVGQGKRVVTSSSQPQSQPPMPAPQQERSLSADAAIPPVAVERPFDLELPGPTQPPLPVPTDTTLPPLPHPIFEPEHPLAYPEDAAPPILHPHPHDQDEPSDFEWRNLKKLTVLVLSSLIWKNKQVQDQVREAGGLEVLVSCCRHDEHNPYIREHAIMCLRFAVEGNEANAAVIKRMAEEKSAAVVEGVQLQGGNVTLSSAIVEDHVNVPREVLDTNGYETFVDAKGQVGLRRKDMASTVGSIATAAASGSVSNKALPPRLSGPSPITATKMTAEKAAELMQNALRDLPLGDKLVTDKQKAEALARLDRAFESTEKALGGNLKR